MISAAAPIGSAKSAVLSVEIVPVAGEMPPSLRPVSCILSAYELRVEHVHRLDFADDPRRLGPCGVHIGLSGQRLRVSALIKVHEETADLTTGHRAVGSGAGTVGVTGVRGSAGHYQQAKSE